jgi:hypothetical protein
VQPWLRLRIELAWHWVRLVLARHRL